MNTSLFSNLNYVRPKKNNEPQCKTTAWKLAKDGLHTPSNHKTIIDKSNWKKKKTRTMAKTLWEWSLLAGKKNYIDQLRCHFLRGITNRNNN